MGFFFGFDGKGKGSVRALLFCNYVELFPTQPVGEIRMGESDVTMRDGLHILSQKRLRVSVLGGPLTTEEGCTADWFAMFVWFHK